MKHTRAEILIDGFSFVERPRWREGRLWFSDMIGQKVYTVDLKGNLKEIVEVPNRPSGLGFLPDGTLLIASMRDNRMLRFDGHELALHADLQSLAVGEINDMVVDRTGRAYVGSFDFHRSVHGVCERGRLILVDSQGRTQAAVNGLRFPNGAAVTADDKTLIVAETFGNRLLAFVSIRRAQSRWRPRQNPSLFVFWKAAELPIKCSCREGKPLHVNLAARMARLSSVYRRPKPSRATGAMI